MGGAQALEESARLRLVIQRVGRLDSCDRLGQRADAELALLDDERPGRARLAGRGADEWEQAATQGLQGFRQGQTSETIVSLPPMGEFRCPRGPPSQMGILL